MNTSNFNNRFHPSRLRRDAEATRSSQWCSGSTLSWKSEGEGRPVYITMNNGRVSVGLDDDPKSGLPSVTHERNGSNGLFFNREQVGAISVRTTKSNAPNLRIFSRSKYGRYHGLPDEPMIFKRALSPNDAWKLFIATK